MCGAGWSFEEGEGTTTDDLTLNGFDGVLHNAPDWTPGWHGTALSFDGLNQRVHTGDVDYEGGEMTLSVWVILSGDLWDAAEAELTAVGGSKNSGIILSKPATTGYSYTLLCTPEGEVEFSFWGNTENSWSMRSQAGLLQENAWHHITVRLEEASQELFIDHQRVATGSLSLADWNLSDEPLVIGDIYPYGSDSGISPSAFPGLIDEVRVYDRALIDAEVAALATEEGYLTPSYPGIELIRTHALWLEVTER